MNAYLEILRPVNALMAVIVILLMAIISGNFTLDVLLAVLVIFTVFGAGNVINDYFDHRIDAINKPGRPIPSGRIRLKTALIYSISLFIIGIIIAFFISLIMGIIALLSSILMIWYAYSLKRMVIIGNLSISFLTGLCFVFGGIAANEIITSIYLGFYAFLMTMAREIVKDMEDMEGDKADGANTLPIAHGGGISSKLAAFLMIIDSISSPIVFFLGILTIYYLVAFAPAFVLFIYCAWSILKDQSVENTRDVSKKIKIGIGIAFLAFAAGSPFLLSLIR